MRVCVYIYLSVYVYVCEWLNGDVRLHSGRSGSVEVEMYRGAGLPEKAAHHREESVKTALYVMKQSLDIHNPQHADMYAKQMALLSLGLSTSHSPFLVLLP